MYDEHDNNKPKSLGTEENKNMKTITELRQDQELLITAVNILDRITCEENNISREDVEFTAYESWAVTDVKNELQAKIGELQVLIEYQDDNNDDDTVEQVTEPLTTTQEEITETMEE